MCSLASTTPVRLGGPGHRQPAVDDRADDAALDVRPHVVPHGGDDLGLAAVPGRPGGARSVVACTDARLAMSFAEVELGLRAALHADRHQPAADGQGVDVAGQVLRAHVVEDDVDAGAVGLLLDPLDEVLVAVVDASRRRRARGRRRAWPPCPAVVNTRAPARAASWMAIVPMPLEPPCTRKASPRRSPASMNTFDQTVQVTSGSAAAVASSTPAGRGSSCPAGTATRSA